MKRTVLVAAMGLGLLALNLRRDLAQTHAAYRWKPVKVGTLHKSILSAGVMEAVQVSELRSDVTEQVSHVLVDEGRPVKKGEPIMELTRERTQLDYQTQLTSYRDAEAGYKKSIRNYDIQRKLLRNMAVSRADVEEAADARQKAKEALDIQARELDLSRKRLDGTTVRSPMDGTVLKISAREGDKVEPGKALATVGDTRVFIVRTKVDELDIRQVKKGQEALIEADAYPGVVLKGRVDSIASEAERDAFAKIEMIITITDSAGAALKHNLSVRVKILTGDIADAVGVPIQAISQKEGDRGRVLVRSPWGLIREKIVKLGPVAGDDVEVLTGLKAGDSVAVESAAPRLQ